MTVTAPPTVPPTPGPRSARARVAARIRLAWRQALRTPGASALVAGLVAIGAGYLTWAVVDSFSRSSWIAEDLGMLLWAIAPPVLIAGFAVVLLAGSALMVSTRQQQRAHAIAAAVGARRSDIHGVVLIQGAMLGLAGGIIGIVGGGIIAAVTISLVPQWDGFLAPLVIPWAALPWLLAFSIVITVAAAAVPARAASLAEPLTALRDARAESRGKRGRRVAAVALVAGGVALTAAGLIFFSLPNPSGPAWFALLGAAAGPVLVIIGFLLGSRWVLRAIAAVLGRFGTAARIAGRDAAASPRRVAPAIAVVAASAFVATALGTFMSTAVKPFADSHQWSAAANSVVVTIHSPEAGAEDEARAIVESSDPDEIVTVSAPALPQLGPDDEPDFPTYLVAVNSGDCETCFTSYAEVAIVPEDGIDAVLNTEVPSAVRDVLREGGAVIPVWPGQEPGITRAEVLESTLARDMEAEDGPVEPLRTTELPAIEISVHSIYTAIITPETAASLGIDAEPRAMIGTQSAPLSQGQIEALEAQAASGYPLAVSIEEGPSETVDTVTIGFFLPAIILALAASAIALGLSRYERRHDAATLAALGASRSLIRRIGVWEALIVTGTGALVGTLAGAALILGYAPLASNPSLLAWPWGWMAALVLGLPAVAALVAWLVPPGRPDPVRRTAIA